MQKINSSFENLVQTIQTLRSENGCPWDKKQTTTSLKKYLLEEFNEIMEAIDKKDNDNLCEELGDFIYLIIMISEINNERQLFSLTDVLDSINSKLVRRHPHVFAGTPMPDEKTLREQWEKIKKSEKAFD